MTDPVWASRARAVLRRLHLASPSVRSSAIVSYDGLIRASVLNAGVDADRFGAMCASLLSLSTRAAAEVEREPLRQVILDGEQGPVLLTRAGDTGVLAVAADPTPNLGKLILDTRAVAVELAAMNDLKASA